MDLKLFYAEPIETGLGRKILLLALDKKDAEEIIWAQYPDVKNIWILEEITEFERGSVIYEVAIGVQCVTCDDNSKYKICGIDVKEQQGPFSVRKIK